ncbi:MAG: group II truncated hemoglobin [Pseudomonadales bacterium]
MPDQPQYGTGDATFQAAGGEEGIRRLVDRFYDIMAGDPKFATIWSWHPADHSVSRDKLARFLCAWMGGPRRFSEKYGPISIPQAHQHLPVTRAEQEQWLTCMAQALADQGYPQGLMDYLLEQLAVPAGRIVQMRAQTEASGEAGQGS